MLTMGLNGAVATKRGATYSALLSTFQAHFMIEIHYILLNLIIVEAVKYGIN